VKTLREVREEHIRKVLEESRWDTKEASHILQVSEKFLMTEVKKFDKKPVLSDAKHDSSTTQKGKNK
jgi:hypothetical protein